MYPIDFFYRAARRHPDRIALDSPGATYRYSRLRAEVDALACALQAADPRPSSRVCIGAGNTAGHIVALLAVLAAGKTWVPLNTRSTAPELARIVQATEPGILIMDDTGAPLLEPALAAHDAVGIRLDGSGPGTLADLLARHAGGVPVRHALSRDDTQAIKFTGGTTGMPKGVMQPYRAWNALIVNQIANWELTEDDRYVVAAPVTHGTSTYLLPVLAQGGTHLLLDTINPDTITQAFRERGGTLSFMPPTLIYMLMAQEGVSRADFPALRALIYGGAPMPVDKLAEVQAFFGPVVGTTYGQTEAPQIVTAMRPRDFDGPHRRGAVGRVTWFSELAIMAPDGTLLPDGQAGEIVVRGDLVMSGYWRLPEKTAETIVDGWLHTGDVGMLDPEGFLHIKDRLRDVIITGGFNVYPIDVENALANHPAVYESAVFGLPHEKWGEAVHAAVQLHAGRTASADALRAHVRALLGPVQAPKYVHFYDSLPRSPVGKVLKTAVREQVSREASAVAGTGH